MGMCQRPQLAAELVARIEVKTDLEAVQRLQQRTQAEKHQQPAPADHMMPAGQPTAQDLYAVIRGQGHPDRSVFAEEISGSRRRACPRLSGVGNDGWRQPSSASVGPP